MKVKLSPSFLFLGSFLLSLFSPSLQALTTKQPAPDFELTGQDGKAYKLSSYRDKWVVLEWFNKECPFVKKHYSSSNMQKLQKEYTGKNVIWLTINSSAPGKQGHLTQEETLAVKKELKSAATAMLLDPEGKVGKAYDAKTTPHMYIIDPKGILAYQGAIDNRATTEASDIPESRNYVKETLDLALAGKEIPYAQTKAYGCSVKYAD